MKKYFVLMASAIVLVACSKKENPNAESNFMLEEPAAAVIPSNDGTETVTPEVTPKDSVTTETK